MKKQKMYEIVGRTNSNKFCNSGWGKNLPLVINSFIKKYPRFKGLAKIKIAFLEEVIPGLFCASANDWETIDSFTSIKELKIYKEG